MITILSMTTNGNFEWSDEFIKTNGSFVKNGEINGDLMSVYCNFAEVDKEYQTDNANIYFNNGVPSYNINSNNLSLIVKFINSVGSLIDDLNNLGNETE